MNIKVIINIFSLIFMLTGSAYTQDLTAKQVISKVNDIMNQKYVKATAKMTITTSSGKKRTFIYETYSKDSGEKNLIKYLSPARVKDQSILMLNNADDIWAYFPRTNRVRKLATHAKKQKMEGSNFSYEDMGSGDTWITGFTSELLKDSKLEGDPCFVIELIKKPETESGYSRLIMWVNKENFFPLQIDYYDEDDIDLHQKRLIMSDIEEINGVPTPMKMIMQNLDDNSETLMEYEHVTYDEILPDELFTERGMKK